MKYLGKITDNKDLVTKEYVDNADATKQATLVSGTNIKTINSTSLLGSGNISVGTSNLALGETSSTAYRGDRGKTAYDHSQSTHARTDATAVSINRKTTSGTNIADITIDGTTTQLYAPTSGGGGGVEPVFSGLANNAGSVVLGDLVVEWGTVSITSGSSGSTAGGVTLYLGQANVTYTNTFAYYPSVSLTWSGNYVNQVALYTYNASNTGFTVMGRMLTANSARSVRWVAIGKKA